VVDIGCGPVASLQSVKAKMKFGIDILARSYQPLGILEHDMIYLAAPAEDLPFVDESVDAIVSVNALNHVDDFEAAIEEIYRVLGNSGRVFLAFNLEHTPTIHQPIFLSRERVLAAVEGKFEVDRTVMTRLEGALTDLNAPGGVFVVHGRKIQREASLYQKTTNLLIERMSQESLSLEELDLEYVLKYGAPTSIVATKAAATAFVEYEKRSVGWEKRLIKYWLIAVRYNPRYFLNRGLNAILFRALRSLIFRQG
jgi:SAM-dependent methyltransferase